MISVHILGGFLGAGKTSLLQHILSTAAGPDTVVLVNEFGRLGLDGSRLRRDGLALYELDNGCVCCSLGDELAGTVERAIRIRHPRKILVEASGVADPASVARVIAVIPEPALDRPRVVTVVDARAWRRKAGKGGLFLEQIAEADLVVLNKMDLIPASRRGELLDELRGRCPGKTVLPATYGQVDPAAFWQAGRPAGDAALSRAADGHGTGHAVRADHDAHERHHHDHEFSEVVLAADAPLDEAAFLRFLSGLPAAVLRGKGQVVMGGRARYLDIVDGRVDWSDPPAGITGTCVVLIGRRLDEEALTASFRAVTNRTGSRS